MERYAWSARGTPLPGYDGAEIEAAFVEGPSDDDPFYTRGLERIDVGPRSDASGGDDGNVHGAYERAERPQGGACEHPITRHVSVDEAADPKIS